MKFAPFATAILVALVIGAGLGVAFLTQSPLGHGRFNSTTTESCYFSDEVPCTVISLAPSSYWPSNQTQIVSVEAVSWRATPSQEPVYTANGTVAVHFLQLNVTWRNLGHTVYLDCGSPLGVRSLPTSTVVVHHSTGGDACRGSLQQSVEPGGITSSSLFAGFRYQGWVLVGGGTVDLELTIGWLSSPTSSSEQTANFTVSFQV